LVLPAGGQPLIVAHRGAWGEAPQNSLQALEAAIQVGCEMVEMDVRRTLDGELVVVHDARVRGTPVSELALEDLRRRLAPGQAPLLRDMVQGAAGRIRLDVELKEPGYVGRALQTLADLEPADYVVTSFVDHVLVRVHEVAPRTRTGLLLGGASSSRRLEARMGAAGADFLAPAAGLARAGLLSWAARRELDCYVWTVNERRALRALAADARVTAIITDRPAEALRVRRNVQSPGGSGQEGPEPGQR
jgi:glycerophosphoryl diester phosphodiesterase